MVALTLGTGGGCAAVTAANSVASTCIAPAPGSGVAARSSSESEAGEREAIVGRMLERGARKGTVDPEVAAAVSEELQVLPPGVLRLLDRNHTAIAVLSPGQTPLDVGVILPVDVPARFADVSALQATVSEARRASDDLYGKRVAAAQQEIDSLLGQASDGRSRALLATRRVQLARLTDQRDQVFNQLVYEQSDGRLEPHIDRSPGHADTPSMFGTRARQALTLDEIAAMHGARTPAEREEFTRLVTAINGEHLEKAWRSVAGNEGLSPAERRLHPLEDRIVMPSIYYYRAPVAPVSTPSTGAGIDLIGPYHARLEAEREAQPISGHDATSLQSWAIGAMRGQYWYQGDLNTVVIPATGLGTAPGDRSTLIHELGHAYEDAVKELEPLRYAAHQVDRDAAYTLMQSEGHDFPTPYASTSPSEMSAESFALTFSGNARAVEASDDRWAREFAGFLEETACSAN